MNDELPCCVEPEKKDTKILLNFSVTKKEKQKKSLISFPCIKKIRITNKINWRKLYNKIDNKHSSYKQKYVGQINIFSEKKTFNTQTQTRVKKMLK